MLLSSKHSLLSYNLLALICVHQFSMQYRIPPIQELYNCFLKTFHTKANVFSFLQSEHVMQYTLSLWKFIISLQFPTIEAFLFSVHIIIYNGIYLLFSLLLSKVASCDLLFLISTDISSLK